MLYKEETITRRVEYTQPEMIATEEAAKIAGVNANNIRLYMQEKCNAGQEIEFGICLKNKNGNYSYKIFKQGFIAWINRKNGQGNTTQGDES